MERQNLIAIGIMCGTSKDGIDMMIGETDAVSPLKLIATISLTYPAIFPLALRAAEYGLKQTGGDIKQVDQSFEKYLQEFAKSIDSSKSYEKLISKLKDYLGVEDSSFINIRSLIAKYTALCVDLIKQLQIKAKLDSSKVDVIGDHGISLYHNPSKKITIQIADGQALANTTGIFVVNNFRHNDVKNGGQGAPLAPIYHQALINSNKGFKEAWTVVNLGGTANITLEKDNKLIGFDTGPANILLDAYVRKYSRESLTFDVDGKAALAGSVQEDLLEKLKEFSIDYNSENYLTKIPPKSLDISNYRLPQETRNYSFEDNCATLAAFSSYCVIAGIKLTKAQVHNIIACGGGAKNPAILHYLRQFAKNEIGEMIRIFKASDIGIDSDYAEAELMAFLAVKTMYKEPITFRTTTACLSDTLGGHGYVPENSGASKNATKLIKGNIDLLEGYQRI